MARLCLLAAITIGLLIGVAQVLFDSNAESQRIDMEINTLIDIVLSSATTAAYNIDPVLGQSVVDGLVSSTGIYRASIIIPPSEVLGEKNDYAKHSRLRFFTDLLFGKQRYYLRTLSLNSSDDTLGQLHVYVDTAPLGANFINRAGLTFISGVIQAFILAFVMLAIFYVMLSRPLGLFTRALRVIDPASPARKRLPSLKSHEHDELGQTVAAANKMLQAIEEQGAQRQVAEDEAEYLRQFDHLTDLPNRTLFYGRLRQAIEKARLQKSRVAILQCDVSGFKAINDKLGYSTGDMLLSQFAHRLRSTVPGVSVVARVGGDQFGVIVEEPFDLNTLTDLAKRIFRNGQQPQVVSVPQKTVTGDNQASTDADKQTDHQPASESNSVDQVIELECRTGIAIFPDDAFSADDLIQNAERAMAMAKLRGNKHFQFYVAELEQAIRDRQSLEVDLNTAIENDRLYVVYHPQFSASNQALVGAEALVRWDDDKRGAIPADVFVPLAEESDLITQLGKLVLRRVISDMARWRAAGLPDISIAVNVSAKQLRYGDLPSDVLGLLKASDISAELLELEITETAIMEDIERAAMILNTLRKAGVGLAMDDFGTGHSSLNYLRKLPFNKLKIDRSFVSDSKDTDNSLILKAIISLGHSLNMTVVAEGIESAEQLNFLRDNNCDVVQGFYQSPPLAEADFRKLLEKQQR